MRFADPVYFLLIVPAVVLAVLVVRRRIGREATLRFSSLSTVKSAKPGRAFGGRAAQAILRTLALVFLAVALARPQTGTGEDRTSREVVDIVLALDVSGSMATLDFQPDNRLEAAKLEAKRFIEGRPDDRIGLVVFSGQSITQCPLTVDHQAILTMLDQIRLGMLEDGTAIGLGLANAVNRLKDAQAKSKVVVLLTDGVNNAGEIDPLTAAGLAKQFKVRVYTIGVGKEGTALLPVNDPMFGTRLIKVETEIDEKTLERIARETGGEYFRAQDSRGLREIFKQIDRLEKTEITVERHTHYDEHFFWPAWAAVILLLAEALWMHGLRVKIP